MLYSYMEVVHFVHIWERKIRIYHRAWMSLEGSGCGLQTRRDVKVQWFKSTFLAKYGYNFMLETLY